MLPPYLHLRKIGDLYHMKKLRTVLLLLFMLLVSSTLPVYAQSSAGDFTYEEQGASVTITSYTGADQEVTIPAVINEKTVTAIGDYAFMLCNKET